MLVRIGDLPAGVVGIEAKGEVTREDYEQVFTPLFEEMRGKGDRIRFLYQLGPEFEGFTAGAAFEDARLGLHNLRFLERCAIVSDLSWVRESSRLVGSLLPCPVRVYGNKERKEAVTWLSSPVEGSRVSHRLIAETGVLVVEPKDRLRAEDFDALAITVDPWIEAKGTLNGIVVHAHAFPGWEHLGSFFRHVQFVRDHHRKVKRIALAVDGDFAKVASGIGEHFVKAEIKHFSFDQLDEAIAWAGAPGS